MDSVFLPLYKSYGKYVNKLRAIPYSRDGLRISERRILYSLYLEAKNEYKKSAYIVGKGVIFHPHSPDSLYQTLVKLVRNGIGEPQGNWGNNNGLSDDPAAAMRYTEIKLDEYYKNELKYMEYVDYDIIEFEKEPLYIPVKYPISLLYKELNATIGFGIVTKIPSYTKTDLYNRLINLINNKPNVIIQPSYSGNIVTSDIKECEKLLTTGSAAISFKTIYNIDEVNRKINILGKPISKNFDSLIKKLGNEIDNQIIYIIDKSKQSTDIEIGINKNRKYDFTKLVKIVNEYLSYSVNFIINVYDEEADKVKTISVDEWLLRTYSTFKNTVLKYYETKLIDINKKLFEIDIIEKLHPYIKKYKDESEIEYNDFIETTSKMINVAINNIKEVLDKYNIKSLLLNKFNKDQLLNDIDLIKQIINNIDKYVLTQEYKSKNKKEN